MGLRDLVETTMVSSGVLRDEEAVPPVEQPPLISELLLQSMMSETVLAYIMISVKVGGYVQGWNRYKKMQEIADQQYKRGIVSQGVVGRLASSMSLPSTCLRQSRDRICVWRFDLSRLSFEMLSSLR